MNANPDALMPGHVVQIDPEHDSVFGGQFMVVTDIYPWGVQGYCKPLDDRGGLAYYRVGWEHIEPVGVATWIAE